jgi:hypothetical protein
MSYVNVGYTVDLYTYNPMAEFMTAVPTSPYIRVHDAREILPESALFQYAGRAEVGKRDDAYSYLPFSDLFRFTMLHKKGGAWIDLDVFLTRPIPASVLSKPYVFSAERTIQKGAYKKKEPEIVDRKKSHVLDVPRIRGGVNASILGPFFSMSLYQLPPR